MTRVVDTLIIGASAAGLATAACLKESGQRFEVLEASNVVGQAWRHHYDRLHLHTPKSASALPGLVMPSDWPRYPTRDQVVDYLERYRVHHRLEPRFGQKVTHLERHDDEWVATTMDEEWRTRSVVIATGANPPTCSPDLAGTPHLPGAGHALQRVPQRRPVAWSTSTGRGLRQLGL
jgi:indole-3-pyruvate monooxygenase